MKKIMILMFLMAGSVDAKVVRQTRPAVTVPTRPVVIPTQMPPVITPAPKIISAPTIDQGAIIKRLDDQLNSPVESAWNDRINDIFDLAMIDRDLARDYFVKMRSKMESPDVKTIQVEEKVVSTLPAGEEPMKRATGKPAPSRKPAVLKEGTIGMSQAEVPSSEGMKKGSLPAPKKGAPRGGPAKNIGVKTEVAQPGVPTKVAPKVEQVFSASKLQELDNDKLVEIFNDLLEKLGTVLSNWNGKAVERVEEKTKHGYKVYNVYGAPDTQWKSRSDTLKKVLIAKNVMPQADIEQKIADRIIQVRAEKTVKPIVIAQPEEKPKEELTEEDLVRLIKVQFAEPKVDQIGWVVSVKRNIRALDQLNHASAMEYHDKFIQLTKEKPFLK
jgi:hypothetical protein